MRYTLFPWTLNLFQMLCPATQLCDDQIRFFTQGSEELKEGPRRRYLTLSSVWNITLEFAH